MTKTEAIRYLESIGWRFKNKKRTVVTVSASPYPCKFTEFTTKELIDFARMQQSFEAERNEWEQPLHKEEPTITEIVPVLERDTQAIANAIEKACRIVVMVAVACYVAGYTLGVWVHTANAWLVALHKRTCKERVDIVAGYIVSGILYTHATIREAMA